jgi:hypothetical protein
MKLMCCNNISLHFSPCLQTVFKIPFFDASYLLTTIFMLLGLTINPLTPNDL